MYHGCDEDMLGKGKSLLISSNSSAQISPIIHLKNVMHFVTLSKTYFLYLNLQETTSVSLNVLTLKFSCQGQGFRVHPLEGQSKDGFYVIDWRSQSPQGLLIIHDGSDV